MSDYGDWDTVISELSRVMYDAGYADAIGEGILVDEEADLAAQQRVIDAAKDPAASIFQPGPTEFP
jgi:hypothetical protein